MNILYRCIQELNIEFKNKRSIEVSSWNLGTPRLRYGEPDGIRIIKYETKEEIWNFLLSHPSIVSRPYVKDMLIFERLADVCDDKEMSRAYVYFRFREKVRISDILKIEFITNKIYQAPDDTLSIENLGKELSSSEYARWVKDNIINN